MNPTGTFTTNRSGVTRIRLNAPYDLSEYGGWVVVVHVAGKPERVLLRT